MTTEATRSTDNELRPEVFDDYNESIPVWEERAEP